MASIIWLASYPKSGNTWLRLLLANLLSGIDAPVDINNLDLTGIFPVLREQVDQIALVDSEILRPSEADLLRPYMIKALLEAAGPEAGDQFAKVHDAYRYLPDGTPLLGKGLARAALYILRDPRDMAVSMSHFYKISLDKAVFHINEGWYLSPPDRYPKSQVPQSVLDWSSHVRSWTEQRDVPTHLLRFEDLLADTVATFGRAVAFLGLSVSPVALERAARHTRFSELQRQEREQGFKERHLWAGDCFFRAGKAGGWVDVLTKAQAAAITAAHGEMMAAYGYL